MKINHDRILRGLLAIAVLGIITVVISQDQVAQASLGKGGTSIGPGASTGVSDKYEPPPPDPTGPSGPG